MRRPLIFLLLLAHCPLARPAQETLTPGELARFRRGETLTFQGKNIANIFRDGELPVLRIAGAETTLGFLRETGETIPVTVPSDALQPTPPSAWRDLTRGVEAFRDGQPGPAVTLLRRAAQDKEWQPIANSILGRVNTITALARTASPQPLAAAAGSLRDAAAQLVKLGHPSLALALDIGTDKAAAALGSALPPGKIDRAELTPRVAKLNTSVALARQFIAARKMIAARDQLDAGLAIAPLHPELLAAKTRIERDLAEADTRYEAAQKMARFDKGAIHAITAIEHGMKACADHPRLIALRKELDGVFETRTSPRITPEFIKLTGHQGPTARLEEGRQLYVTRCAECHELEQLETRSASEWEKAVGGMSRRAGLAAADQSKINAYLALAVKAVPAE